MLNVPTRGGKEYIPFVSTVHVATDVNRAPNDITALAILVFQSLRKTPLILPNFGPTSLESYKGRTLVEPK